MDAQLIRKLNHLNTQFYNTVASDFDASRQHFWPGWNKIPPLLEQTLQIDHPLRARILDLGCGNGRFGQFLHEKCPHLTLSYTGIDANAHLLQAAENTLEGKIPALHLHQLDIIEALLSNSDFLEEQKFQLIGSFGVFHHIPSFELRLSLLKYLLSKLEKNGVLVISFWQFMKFERFQKKVVPTEDILEKNDFILDWNRGKTALRYCHFTPQEEQEKLCELAGADLVETYFADGKEETVNQYVVLTQKDIA